ncbi:hypothetical protein [Roseibium sp.]
MGDHRFDALDVVSEIASSLICARCGSEEVQTFAVERNQVNGYWPAESS